MGLLGEFRACFTAPTFAVFCALASGFLAQTARPVRAALRELEVRELLFPADTAVRLAQLRATTGLRMPDCCVLLAAEDAAGSVASFDARLAAAAENRKLSVLRR